MKRYVFTFFFVAQKKEQLTTAEVEIIATKINAQNIRNTKITKNAFFYNVLVRQRIFSFVLQQQVVMRIRKYN